MTFSIASGVVCVMYAVCLVCLVCGTFSVLEALPLERFHVRNHETIKRGTHIFEVSFSIRVISRAFLPVVSMSFNTLFRVIYACNSHISNACLYQSHIVRCGPTP